MGIRSAGRAAIAGCAITGALAGGLVGALAGAAAAQEGSSTNRVATETDWFVFVEENPSECWAVSEPKETVNTRDGRVVAVRRGEIQLFVVYKPSENVVGQVSFTGGYPFAEGSTVEVEIGDRDFTFYTENRLDAEGDRVGWAWPAPDDDAAVMAAMKAGVSATLTARSSRGTTTEDTFSLLGFTAASEDAETRCSG